MSEKEMLEKMREDLLKELNVIAERHRERAEEYKLILAAAQAAANLFDRLLALIEKQNEVIAKLASAAAESGPDPKQVKKVIDALSKVLEEGGES